MSNDQDLWETGVILLKFFFSTIPLLLVSFNCLFSLSMYLRPIETRTTSAPIATTKAKEETCQLSFHQSRNCCHNEGFSSLWPLWSVSQSCSVDGLKTRMSQTELSIRNKDTSIGFISEIWRMVLEIRMIWGLLRAPYWLLYGFWSFPIIMLRMFEKRRYRPTDWQTDGPSDGWTKPLIERLRRI